MLDLLLGFAIIIILVSRKVNYGASMIVGALSIAILGGLAIGDYVTIVRNTFQYSTVRLILIILLINILGYLMREFGQMDRALSSLEFLGSKYVIAVIPFLFGLMPMPGGALVSAPIIDPECNRLGIAPEKKTFINMWFRHAIFFIFPLSNAIILASELSSYSVYEIILYQLPFFLLTILVGAYFLRGIPTQKSASKVNPSFLWHLFPILLVILLNLFFGIDFVYGLLIAILLVFFQNRRLDLKLAAKGFSPSLVVALVGIMFFRFTIEKTDATSFLKENLPSQMLIFALPWFIGMLTGLNLTSIGISFPILAPLMDSPFDAVAIYVAGTLGYVSSPLHLCLIVTNDYFKSQLSRYFRLAIPALFVLFLLELVYVLFL